MKKVVFFILLSSLMATFAYGADPNPATVIITAGQSNTDGRVGNDLLPDYIRQNKELKESKENFT